MSTQKGYSSQEKEDRLSAQFQTIEPVRTMQFGSTVVSHEFVYEVGTDAAEAGSTASIIVATGHSALRGDVIRLTSGALSGREVKVWSVAANSITLAETLPSAVAAAVTFQILRHKYPTVDASGALITLATEAATAADGGALPAVVKVVGGYDGAAVQVLKTDANGELQVDVVSSALPSGAATEATLSALSAKVITADTDNVTIVSSVLPTGAATEVTLATLATEATVSTLATAAAQTDGSQKTQIVDGSGNVISSTANALDVNLKSPITVDVSLSQANDSVAVFGNDGAVNRALKTDANGELQIDVLSSALPTGAATEVTLATLGTESTLNAIKTSVELIDNAVSGNEIQVDVVTSALPTGASTEATLLAVEADTTAIAGCVLGTELQVDIVSSALPSGAATEVTLAAIQTAVELIDNTVSGSELQVDVVAALPAGTNTIGKVDVNTLSVVETLFVDTASTTINGNAGALVQVIASTAASVKKVQLLDTTGAFIGLYVGPAASEVLKVIIGPGSDQTIEHSIPASSRITVKRLDSATNITTGILAINFIGG